MVNTKIIVKSTTRISRTESHMFLTIALAIILKLSFSIQISLRYINDITFNTLSVVFPYFHELIVVLYSSPRGKYTCSKEQYYQ